MLLLLVLVLAYFGSLLSFAFLTLALTYFSVRYGKAPLEIWASAFMSLYMFVLTSQVMAMIYRPH